jgi:uncharacterized membrane protein YesL
VTGRRWEHSALRALEYVAYPALAGAAWCLLAVGVVTWLPALASVATVLRQWQSEGHARCFVGVFRAFPGQWSRLWRHALASTAVASVLAGNLLFLSGRPGPPAFILFTLDLGLAAALVPYHLALAVVAGRDTASAPRAAVELAFGSPKRGLVLLGAALLAPVITLPIPFGPLLLGPTLPVLVALIADRRSHGSGNPAGPRTTHPSRERMSPL